jgi:CheY-like chemotaxis protein
MPDATNRILVVDDEECIRKTMSLVLTELGYSVRTAEDGFSALHEIRLEHPDILLSDLNMAGMSGFELLLVVRRRFPAMLVVAMSGAFCGNEVPSGVAADAFYQKGCSISALLHILRTPPKIRRNTLPACSCRSPLWIQRMGSDSQAKPQVTIGCPECLRTFPQVLDNPDCAAHEVVCIHCGNLIEFEIIEPSDRMPQQAFRRRAGTAFAAQSASAASN